MGRSTTRASWDDLETFGLRGALDQLDPPGGIGHGPAQLSAAVGAVGEDRLREGKELAGVAIQNQKGAVAVLYVGRVDDDGEDQAEGIDEEMALLARVIARQAGPLTQTATPPLASG